MNKEWYDKKIFRILGGVVDTVWISILWYISSILVFTIGPAVSAMYYTLHTCTFKGRGHLFSVYKKSFFENFRKAAVIWLICLLADAFLVFDHILTRMAIDQGSALAVLYYPVLACGALLMMWQLSALAYQARFDDSIKNVILKSAYIAYKHFGWLIFLTAFLALAIALCRYLIVLVVVLPGGYGCLMHHVFEHIYGKEGWIKEEEEEERNE